jgi:hypothetical protein
LFAKILLDKIAHSLEFYFGQARNLSLDSHDQLAKNLISYATQKGLSLPSGFIALAGKLKTDISDYRDYEIAHEKSPRRMSATLLDNDGKMRIAGLNLYPTAKDRQIETKKLHDLLSDIDSYIRQMIELMESNQEKTRLEINRKGPMEQ